MIARGIQDSQLDRDKGAGHIGAARLATLVGVAFLAQGCVAAAIPLAAGGLMAGAARVEAPAPAPAQVDRTAMVEQTDNDIPPPLVAKSNLRPDARPVTVASPPGLRPSSSPAEIIAPSPQRMATTPTPALRAAPASTLAPSGSADASSSPSEQRAEPAPSFAIPTVRPAQLAGRAPAKRVESPDVMPQRLAQKYAQTMEDRALADFIEYAAINGANAPGRAPVSSAVLIDPRRLAPERERCDGEDEAPIVLIDLDPGATLFDPDRLSGSQLEASLALATLRQSGVGIAWISDNTAGMADEVRLALERSGLDPLGADRLLLMRYPGDRKQSRRQELSVDTCLLAIAGDRRSDFDELYDYVVDINAAAPLEQIIGNGWFLTPSLLSFEGAGQP